MDVYNGLFFTNDCQIGGKLFAHIISKEVVYYFGKPDTITFQNNSILTKLYKFMIFLIIKQLTLIFNS
ncbi:hypothetical protein GLOIN_2v1766725 [Rhizophagus irregularis DAOM 181602=DAOM 197198]|nr:hypothetical protein RhiirB3_160699 [Rhizophagus irregularis]GET53566.1 hypothetical protein GLOIN_2v1766725 [Rhizophagus irregularis DAOM 181602=DAOM 197198]